MMEMTAMKVGIMIGALEDRKMIIIMKRIINSNIINIITMMDIVIIINKIL